MKKLLVALIAVAAMLLMTSVVSAQTPMKITKGVKIGLNMANITGDDVDLEGDGMVIEPSSRTGISGGFFLGFNVAPGITIQPEVLYSMKGAKYEEGGESLTYKIDYIAIPVLLKYSFATPGNVKPNLFVGGELAFKSSAKQKYEGSEGSAEMDLEDVKSTDFGLVVGAGVDLNAGARTIMFDIRYVLGMSKVPDIPEGETEVDIKNSTLMFSAGIGF